MYEARTPDELREILREREGELERAHNRIEYLVETGEMATREYRQLASIRARYIEEVLNALGLAHGATNTEAVARIERLERSGQDVWKQKTEELQNEVRFRQELTATAQAEAANMKRERDLLRTQRDRVITAYAIEGDHCEENVVGAIVYRQARAIEELVQTRDKLRGEIAKLDEQAGHWETTWLAINKVLGFEGSSTADVVDAIVRLKGLQQSGAWVALAEKLGSKSISRESIFSAVETLQKRVEVAAESVEQWNRSWGELREVLKLPGAGSDDILREVSGLQQDIHARDEWLAKTKEPLPTEELKRIEREWAERPAADGRTSHVAFWEDAQMLLKELHRLYGNIETPQMMGDQLTDKAQRYGTYTIKEIMRRIAARKGSPRVGAWADGVVVDLIEHLDELIDAYAQSKEAIREKNERAAQFEKKANTLEALLALRDAHDPPGVRFDAEVLAEQRRTVELPRGIVETPYGALELRYVGQGRDKALQALDYTRERFGLEKLHPEIPSHGPDTWPADIESDEELGQALGANCPGKAGESSERLCTLIHAASSRLKSHALYAPCRSCARAAKWDSLNRDVLGRMERAHRNAHGADYRAGVQDCIAWLGDWIKGELPEYPRCGDNIFRADGSVGRCELPESHEGPCIDPPSGKPCNKPVDGETCLLDSNHTGDCMGCPIQRCDGAATTAYADEAIRRSLLDLPDPLKAPLPPPVPPPVPFKPAVDLSGPFFHPACNKLIDDVYGGSCVRAEGHEGPCTAHPHSGVIDERARGVPRARVRAQWAFWPSGVRAQRACAVS